MAESIQIVAWLHKLKDLNKVHWRYAKENGSEKFPRKLPTRKKFKVIVDRFRKTGSVKPETPPREKPVTRSEEKVRNLVTRNVGICLQSPLDYFLWGIAETEVRRVKPKSLEELKTVVSDFVECLDEDVVRRAVRDIRPRAELCIKMGGGHFESQLKKYKRGAVEE